MEEAAKPRQEIDKAPQPCFVREGYTQLVWLMWWNPGDRDAALR